MLRLDLVVGPNGAGKSTFVRQTLAPVLPPDVVLVNADDIAARRWPSDPEARSYDAAQVAHSTRKALLAARRPFIAETVFSQPSKLELLEATHDAGYHVFLHVLLVPEELSVARVAHQVAAGGHAVPEEKIRARHRRLWTNVVAAMTAADAATVYDNSHHAGPRIVAQIIGGVPTGVITWPAWTPEDLSTAWPAT